jgi:hypothetical protein
MPSSTTKFLNDLRKPCATIGTISLITDENSVSIEAKESKGWCPCLYWQDTKKCRQNFRIGNYAFERGSFQALPAGETKPLHRCAVIGTYNSDVRRPSFLKTIAHSHRSLGSIDRTCGRGLHATAPIWPRPLGRSTRTH